MGICPPIWRLFCYKWRMLRSLKLLFVLHFDPVALAAIYLLENLALRQQLAVLKTDSILTPRFARTEQIVLGDIAAPLAGMETSVDSCPARDRCSLASGRIQVVLDVALAASQPCGKKMRQPRITRTDFSAWLLRTQPGAHRAFM